MHATDDKSQGLNAMAKVQFGGRLEPELIEQVREEARKSRRTLGMELTVLVEEALAARERARSQERLTQERTLRSTKRAAE
jgi:hypothetical protein